MANSKVTLTQDRLKELLHYDPETGVFTWLPRPRSNFISSSSYGAWNARYAGKTAGVSTHGYRKISIDDQKHYAHRLAWLYMTGQWPTSLVDHKNETGSDNRWSNLRLATKSTNGSNRRAACADNKLGFRGVVAYKNKYVAQCHVGKGPHYIGLFNTPEEAHAAYARTLNERVGEFSPYFGE